MTRFHRIAIFLLGLWLVCCGETCEAQDPMPPAQPSVFDLPRIYSQQMAAHRQMALVLVAKDDAKAEGLLKAAIERIPHDVTAHYNLACVLAREEKADAAFTELRKAVELGWRDAKHLAADPDLESLRKDERFAEAVKAAEGAAAEKHAGLEVHGQTRRTSGRRGCCHGRLHGVRSEDRIAAGVFPRRRPMRIRPSSKAWGKRGNSC